MARITPDMASSDATPASTAKIGFPAKYDVLAISALVALYATALLIVFEETSVMGDVIGHTQIVHALSYSVPWHDFLGGAWVWSLGGGVAVPEMHSPMVYAIAASMVRAFGVSPFHAYMSLGL